MKSDSMPLALYFWKSRSGGLCGAWGRNGAVPEEERRALLRGLIDEVEHRLHTFTADLQAVVAVPPAGIREAAGHAVRKAASLVTAFPPLAGLMAEITVLAEQRRNRRMLVQMRDQSRA